MKCNKTRQASKTNSGWRSGLGIKGRSQCCLPLTIRADAKFHQSGVIAFLSIQTHPTATAPSVSGCPCLCVCPCLWLCLYACTSVCFSLSLAFECSICRWFGASALWKGVMQMFGEVDVPLDMRVSLNLVDLYALDVMYRYCTVALPGNKWGRTSWIFSSPPCSGFLLGSNTAWFNLLRPTWVLACFEVDENLIHVFLW